MTYQPHPKGTVLLKAKRETLVLLVSASALTFAISYAVHKRPVAETAAMTPVQQQVWAGHLADVGAEAGGGSTTNEPMTSASLVVPAAAVALPVAQMPPRPAAVSPKPTKACEGPACAVKVALPVKAPTTTVPVVATVASANAAGAATPVKVERKEKPGLMAKLNPMNHLPESVRHPIDYAGDAVSNWFKRL